MTFFRQKIPDCQPESIKPVKVELMSHSLFKEGLPVKLDGLLKRREQVLKQMEQFGGTELLKPYSERKYPVCLS